MPCYPFSLDGGKSTGFICTRGRQKAQVCACGKPAGLLCDYPLRVRTCDAPICPRCTLHAGPETDYCPKHSPFVFPIGDHKIIIVNQRLRGTNESELCDRTTPLGNPYRLTSETTREEVLERFKRYLWEMLQTAGPVRKEMERFAEAARERDLILICHCAPLSCHAQIIAKAIKWMIESDS